MQNKPIHLNNMRFQKKIPKYPSIICVFSEQICKMHQVPSPVTNTNQ